MSDPADQPVPKEIIGRRVLRTCPDCDGEGKLWGFDKETHWAKRCERCNCIGFILDMPPEYLETDPDNIPF